MSYIFTITEVKPGFTVSVHDSSFTVGVTDQNVNVSSTNSNVVVQSTTSNVAIQSNATLIQTKSLFDTFRGEWQYGLPGAFHYYKGDFVRYNDQIWLCKTSHDSTNANGYPNGSADFPTRWELLAVGSVFTATSGVLDAIDVKNAHFTNIEVENTATLGDIVATDAVVTNLTASTINGLTFPSDGKAKQVLTTNGSGTLYWSTVSSIATATVLTGNIELKDDDFKTTFYADRKSGVVVESNTHFIGLSDNTSYRTTSTMLNVNERGVVVSNEGGINDPYYNNLGVALNGTGSTSTTYPYPSLSLDDVGRSALQWTPTYWERTLKSQDPTQPTVNQYFPASESSARAQLTQNTNFWHEFPLTPGGVTPPSPHFGNGAIGVSTYAPGPNLFYQSEGFAQSMDPGWISSASTASNVGTGDFTIETWAYIATPKFNQWSNLQTLTDDAGNSYTNPTYTPSGVSYVYDYTDANGIPHFTTVENPNNLAGLIEPNFYPQCPVVGYGRFQATRGEGAWYNRDGYSYGIDSLDTGAAHGYRTGLGWQLNLHMGSMFFEAGEAGEESTFLLNNKKVSRRVTGSSNVVRHNGPYIPTDGGNFYWGTGGPQFAPTSKSWQKQLIDLGYVDTSKWLVLPMIPTAFEQHEYSSDTLYNTMGFDNPANPTMPYDEWFHVAIVRKNGMASIYINGVKQKLWKQFYGYLPSDPDLYEVPFTADINVGSGKYHIFGPQNQTYGFKSFANPKRDWKFVQGFNSYNAAKYTANFTPEARDKLTGLHQAFKPSYVLKEYSNQAPLGNAVGPTLRFEQARGDFVLTTPSQNTDTLGVVSYEGWNGSTFTPGAQIKAVAVQNWTTSTKQTKIQFQVANTNTSTLSTPVEITHNLLKITGYGLQFPDGTIQTTAGGGASPTPSDNNNTAGWDFGTIELPSGAMFDGGSFI